ncbi:MAG: DUF3416 domain-containing protein [Bacteroidetes bacterium]|nr:DUF3416 domain-containing protein [Bacteroidota bacterium]
MSKMLNKGRHRVIISTISPSINNGQYALKRVLGEAVDLNCLLYADGHDVIRGRVLWKHSDQQTWQHTDLVEGEEDAFSATIHFNEIGAFEYKVQAWVDHGLTWLERLALEFAHDKDLEVLINDGRPYLEALIKAKHPKAKSWLKACEENYLNAAEILQEEEVRNAFTAHPIMDVISESDTHKAYCDRKKAGFSATYELFPRSSGKAKAGRFKDVEALIPRIADLGFDTVLFPPIHPIGEKHRKGKNNSTAAQKGDVGSPWGIGSKDGGHCSIHPDLGTDKEFSQLINKLKEQHLELALDLSFHVSPDHPWIKEHPEWFKNRSDGNLQYAENPPFKYEDIYPFDFECEEWEELWLALKEVVVFWIKKGVKIFRADNAHTKPYHFWSWLIDEVQSEYPEVLFQTNAQSNEGFFLELSKLGFAQMGSAFIWKNFRHELIDYCEELFSEPYIDFLRPSFWPNSHDHLPLILQSGNASAFMARLFLAGTLSANYGIYGPVFENLENEALPGTEEYRDSEKYEIKQHHWDTENKVTWLMRTLNAARKELSPLQQNRNFRFLEIENQALIGFIKWDDQDRVVCVTNLDPYNAQEGWLQLPEDLMPLNDKGYRMHDYISGADYPWREEWNYVRLDPARPVHLFKVID